MPFWRWGFGTRLKYRKHSIILLFSWDVLLVPKRGVPGVFQVVWPVSQWLQGLPVHYEIHGVGVAFCCPYTAMSFGPLFCLSHQSLPKWKQQNKSVEEAGAKPSSAWSHDWGWVWSHPGHKAAHNLAAFRGLVLVIISHALTLGKRKNTSNIKPLKYLMK